MTRTTLLLAALALVACSRHTPPAGSAPAASLDPATLQQADDIFKNRCTPCHGPNGRGDGPASASLDPHPRNFTDKTWQKAVTDEHIAQILQYGGAAVGKSPNMPPNPDLQGKPVVQALVKKVRGFAAN
jgi:mono/diheme cytochrome c family protein